MPGRGRWEAGGRRRYCRERGPEPRPAGGFAGPQ